MNIPANLISGQTRTAYINGFNAAQAGREPAPYAGKATQKAYMAGYTAGKEATAQN